MPRPSVAARTWPMCEPRAVCPRARCVLEAWCGGRAGGARFARTRTRARAAHVALQRGCLVWRQRASACEPHGCGTLRALPSRELPRERAIARLPAILAAPPRAQEGGGINADQSGDVSLAGASTISNCSSEMVRLRPRTSPDAREWRCGRVVRCPAPVWPRGRGQCASRAMCARGRGASSRRGVQQARRRGESCAHPHTCPRRACGVATWRANVAAARGGMRATRMWKVARSARARAAAGA